MGIRHGQIRPNVWTDSYELDGDGLLRVSLAYWKRKPRKGEVVFVGHTEDDNLVVFADVVSIEGEWPAGKAALRVTDGPYELFDPCDDPPDY